jgi:hypothetical protein
MKNRTRFEKLARGCFAMTLSLAEWLEFEQILSSSRKARRMFRQRAERRLPRRQLATNHGAGLFTGAGNWLAATKFQ